jgi:hypothetical protein
MLGDISLIWEIPVKVLMPLEGERAAEVLRALPEVEEMVVLEERL